MNLLNKDTNYYPYDKVLSEISRLNIDASGKCVLALNFKMYFPYSSMITGSIALKYKDKEGIVWVDDVIVSNPYPNKATKVMAKNIGRKKAKWFIPLVFDNYNEIQNIESIFAVWKMCGTTIKYKEYAVLEFDIKDVIKPIKDGIYCIMSYENTLNYINDNVDITVTSEDYINITDDKSDVYDDFMILGLNEHSKAELLFDIHTQRSIEFDNIQSEWSKNGRKDVLRAIEVASEPIMKREHNNRDDFKTSVDMNETLISFYRNIITLKDDETFPYLMP